MLSRKGVIRLAGVIMSKLEVLLVRSNAEMQQALAIRRRVFVEEQGVLESIEIDQHDVIGRACAEDSDTQHVLAMLGGLPVATGRLILEDSDGRLHIGRVAVLAEQRGRGLGRAVMAGLHDLARQRGATAVTLAAQLHAIGFYERLGYVARGEIFLDAGIEHRWMDVEL
jgi:predicted GNAT family N-acyltransferase